MQYFEEMHELELSSVLDGVAQELAPEAFVPDLAKSLFDDACKSEHPVGQSAIELKNELAELVAELRSRKEQEDTQLSALKATAAAVLEIDWAPKNFGAEVAQRLASLEDSIQSIERGGYQADLNAVLKDGAPTTRIKAIEVAISSILSGQADLMETVQKIQDAAQDRLDAPHLALATKRDMHKVQEALESLRDQAPPQSLADLVKVAAAQGLRVILEPL